jgi:hypothetical protein
MFENTFEIKDSSLFGKYRMQKIKPTISIEKKLRIVFLLSFLSPNKQFIISNLIIFLLFGQIEDMSELYIIFLSINYSNYRKFEPRYKRSPTVSLWLSFSVSQHHDGQQSGAFL